MNHKITYREACDEATKKKAKFLSSANAFKARIKPTRLRQDVTNKAVATLADGVAFAAAKAHQRPIAMGAAATAFFLYLFRRPLGTLLAPLYVRFRNRDPGISETDDA